MERYREALAACDQIITQQDDPPSRAYLGAARAWAGLGDRGQAFEHLNTAVARGWDNLASTQSYGEFQKDHSTPAWESTLERIQHNAHSQSAVDRRLQSHVPRAGCGLSVEINYYTKAIPPGTVFGATPVAIGAAEAPFISDE